MKFEEQSQSIIENEKLFSNMIYFLIKGEEVVYVGM